MNPEGLFRPIMRYLSRFWLFMEYLLTGGVRSAFAIACYTVLLWLMLTEYFLAGRYPWWQGPWEYFFVIPVLALPAAIAVYGVCRLEANRPPVAPMAFPADMTVPVPAWIAMLREAGENCHEWLLRSFLRWEARLLTRYGMETGTVSFSQLPGLWRGHIRHGLAIAWFPALLVYLVTPFPSRVMEAIAPILSAKAPEVNGIEAKRVDGKKESLAKKPDSNDFFFRPPGFSSGRLTIDAPDFPRVYRLVGAICGGPIPGCSVADPDRMEGGVTAAQPVRAGKARFDFERTIGSLNLQMTLTEFQRDGVTYVTGVDVH